MKSSIRFFVSHAQQAKNKAGQSKARNTEVKEHQNAMARIRFRQSEFGLIKIDLVWN